eukprot:m.237213 g.237213  ORF g.237213 m.237213 type:complete len:398 (+) comp33701_c1_seq3:198-1391(+)
MASDNTRACCAFLIATCIFCMIHTPTDGLESTTTETLDELKQRLQKGNSSMCIFPHYKLGGLGNTIWILNSVFTYSLQSDSAFKFKFGAVRPPDSIRHQTQEESFDNLFGPPWSQSASLGSWSVECASRTISQDPNSVPPTVTATCEKKASGPWVVCCHPKELVVQNIGRVSSQKLDGLTVQITGALCQTQNFSVSRTQWQHLYWGLGIGSHPVSPTLAKVLETNKLVVAVHFRNGDVGKAEIGKNARWAWQKRGHIEFALPILQVVASFPSSCVRVVIATQYATHEDVLTLSQGYINATGRDLVDLDVRVMGHHHLGAPDVFRMFTSADVLVVGGSSFGRLSAVLANDTTLVAAELDHGDNYHTLKPLDRPFANTVEDFEKMLREKLVHSCPDLEA